MESGSADRPIKENESKVKEWLAATASHLSDALILLNQVLDGGDETRYRIKPHSTKWT